MNINAALFTASHIRISPFGGGDDFCGITERADIEELRLRYAETYSTKGTIHVGSLGLSLDKFQFSSTRFDFLSYDCCITHSGVEVVK